MFCELRGPTTVVPNSLARYGIAIAIVLCPGVATAQEPAATIQTAGRVVDVDGAPVANARIGTEGSDVHTTTDASGFYTLSAPLGATLVIEHDGDETGLAVVTGLTIEDTVLRPLDAGETIELHGEKPVEAPGAASLNRAELQRVPGTGGDVVQTLRVMPGVTNIQLPVGLNGIPIRGSSPQDSRVLVDGFEIPLLYHGLVYRSVLPSESIASLDYLPGGFGVENGRATSGIVSITTRPGDTQRSIGGELWRMSAAALGTFLAELPAPMTLGRVRLADGRDVVGFGCTPAALAGARDITSHGSWPAYLASQ